MAKLTDDLMAADLTRLIEPRLQLHWAAQVLVAIADSELPRASDDSQSNLGFDPKLRVIRSRALKDERSFALHPSKGTLLELQGSETRRALELAGHRLSKVKAWAEGSGPETRLRDYEMPAHAVQRGEAFGFDDPHALHALEAWCAFGHETLSAAASPHTTTGEIRLWPHHFDFGGLVLIREGSDPETDPSIGIGMSLGDSTYPQPYFYVNPYGLDGRPANLPELPSGGFWSDQFVGAILLGERAAHSTDAASAFLATSIEIAKELIADRP